MSIDLVPRTPYVSGQSYGMPLPRDGSEEKVEARLIEKIIKSNKPKHPLAEYKKVIKNDLVNYLNKLWNKSYETRSSHDKEILNDIDARLGKYSKEEEAIIGIKGSPNIYMKTTLEKCRALEAVSYTHLTLPTIYSV